MTSVPSSGKRKPTSTQSTLCFPPAHKKNKEDEETIHAMERSTSLEGGDGEEGTRSAESMSSVQPQRSVSVGAVRRPLSAGNRTTLPPKKLVIKPFKVKPKLPDDFEEETWKKLQAAVRAVHCKQAIAHSKEELYRAVEDLCLHKMSARLFSKLEMECDAHIWSRMQGLMGQTPDADAFLSLVDATWKDHCDQMLTILSIFLYLDRTYVIPLTTTVRSLWDMGLQVFRKHMKNCVEVERKIVTGLLSLILRERTGETVNRMLLRNLLRMLKELQIYSESFEAPFLDETNTFYASEGETFMQQTDLPDYLKHVENRLLEESDRVLHYIDAVTRKQLISTVEKQLLANHIMPMLEKGFNNLMRENRTSDLARLYQLVQRVGACGQLKASWVVYIKETGTQIVTDPERDKNMVQDLLDFKEKLSRLLDEAFEKNEEFNYAMKDAFEAFVNIRQNKPAELIAKFIDQLLRSGNKGVTEEELDLTLDRIMTLFRFIRGKDVFEAFYKKDLAKRLLLGKSASFDAEKSMISKLKSECGSGFTNKLEGMFKDVDISRDIMASFRETVRHRSRLRDVELSVNVLTMGYWPTYTPMEVNLSAELVDLQNAFKEFYLSKHSGRKLKWQNSLGSCVLKAYFAKGKKELSVSLFQAIVLLLFNDADRLTYEDLKTNTGIEEKELKRTLQSLACAKFKVLSKQPKGREVNDDDSFVFNHAFEQRLIRIKINTVQMKETTEEQQSTTERVFQDRQYQVDAAIVRVMKTRKALSHTLLINELYNQLQFPIKPQDLKKRIESLIDREYLERDRCNTQVYHYLA